MAYSVDIINLCISHFHDKISVINISKILRVSIANIYKWLNKYNYYFINGIQITDDNFKTIKNNHHHGLNKINQFEKQVCNYVNDNNGCSLNDIINNIPNINISKSSICKILKKNNISNKRFKTRIIPKNIEEINIDRCNVANNFSNEEFINMIAIDEMPIRIDDYTKYGYSKKGVEILKFKKHKQTKKRLTLLMAISSNSIIGYNIIDGSVNSNIYKKFLENINNLIVNKTIIHDNVRFHHSKIIKNYCNDHNIGIQYTAPYSPEFNPIETVFGTIKKKYITLTHDNMENDIIESINSLKQDTFINNYNKCIDFINQYRN